MKCTSVLSMLGLALICAAGTSCKKPKPIDPTNEGIADFLPTNTQNWWLYEASDGTIFKRYFTGRDTVVDQFNYNLFEQVDTNTGTIVKEFYAKFEGNYYTLLKVDNSGSAYVKSQVLNGDPKVGDEWTSNGSFNYGVNIPTKLESEVMSVNNTFTLNNNVVLDSVIEVKSDLYGKLNFVTWTNCGTITMKFRRGVGVISEDYNINVAGFFQKQYSNHILNYHLEP